MNKNNIAAKNNKDEQNIALVQTVSISTPLPPPEWMERYNSINPVIITEILNEFKNNGENNRKITMKGMNLTVSSQWQGFVATILILLFATFCAHINQEKVALAFLGLSFVGILKVLIRKNYKDDQNKDNQKQT